MAATKKFLGLVLWLGVSFAAAAVGARASMGAGSFYAQLSLPSWAPPGAVFGPVWTFLYAMMGVAVWLVWKKGGWPQQRKRIVLFLVQLIANASWSWLFFAWRLGGIATLEIIILWVLVAWTTAEFWREKRLAGVLMLPYLCWVSFASALCFTIWRMNPSQL